MIRYGTSTLWWGILLVAGGALWLADVTAIVPTSPFVVAAFFALAGIGFGYDVARDPGRWWAAIPAGALLGLGALIAFVNGTSGADEWGAATLLAASGIGFLTVYLRDHDHWWALIPGGLLVTVGIVVASIPLVSGSQGIAVVVLGLMAVFLLALALVPVRGRRMVWPLIPAGVVAIVAVFLARDAADALEPFNWIPAASLLVVGLVVVFRAVTRRGRRVEADPAGTR